MPVKEIRAAAQMLLLLLGLGGLCPAVMANTTAAGPKAAVQAFPAPAALAPLAAKTLPRLQLAQDLTILAAPEGAANFLQVQATDSPSGRLRMALLLPLKSVTLKSAAEMVRDGFRAAHGREGSNVDLTVIDTDDSAQNIATLYRDAVHRYDILIGPLSRSGVGAVANSGAVSRPTIALAPPDNTDNTELRLPPKLLVMGLSIEDEARQAAEWAGREHAGGKALIVSTSVAWQKRAARAFMGQWQKSGAAVDVMQLSVAGSQLNGAALAQLKKRVQEDPPQLLFVALGAAQTRQLRGVVGPGVALYGTSQLNPLNLSEITGAERQRELDGVHLLDMPWQLQADHPAVMAYPHPVAVGTQRLGPDLERLYALGIDAYRVAAEIGAGRPDFTIDGVTGKLAVQFDGSHPAIFERTGQQAIYAEGLILPLATSR